METPEYPLVRCERHDAGPVPGYVVCVHLLRVQASIAHELAPEPDAMGELLCAACAADVEAGLDLDVDDLGVICSRCVPEMRAYHAMRRLLAQ